MEHSGTRWRGVSLALALAMAILPAVVASPSAQAQHFKVLYNFKRGSDGAFPQYVTPVQDEAGNLYGTTDLGGAGCGTVFKVDAKTGKETVLHSFGGDSDGCRPYSGLVLSEGTLYGTTLQGGEWDYCGMRQDITCGTVFSVDIETGAETVLYSFTGGTDGGFPYGGLVLSSGELYGTTSAECCGYGTVFEVDVNTGALTVLHTFDGSHGQNPQSGLTLDATGKVLYGTTPRGGSADWGLVFSLTIETMKYTVLYSFTGSRTGRQPFGTLALDSDGNLYGTTVAGGTYDYGTVFKLDPGTGAESVLYNFTGKKGDGAYPRGGVTLGESGSLYGATEFGGSGNCVKGKDHGCGTVFKLVEGTETVLHSFSGSDGEFPVGGLLLGSGGTLYGTTENGGAKHAGVVFSLQP
jgi:uncharacterized repeat protein (TIGR03803 family)